MIDNKSKFLCPALITMVQRAQHPLRIKARLFLAVSADFNLNLLSEPKQCPTPDMELVTFRPLKIERETSDERVHG